MKRRLHAMAAGAAAALAAVPAAPAQALPYCGGTWVNYARCGFEAPAGAFVIKGTASVDGEGSRQAEVSVRVFVQIAGVQHTVGSCTRRGRSPVTCTAVVNTDFDGLTHQCEVYGDDGGTFLCADPPRLPVGSRVR